MPDRIVKFLLIDGTKITLYNFSITYQTTINMKQFFLISVLTCILSELCIAEQRVGGTISSDTRWSAENGPYIIENDLVIERNARLTIRPGTQIIISQPSDTTSSSPGKSKLLISIKVRGIFQCVGRIDQRITIVPQQNNIYNSWQGIVLDSTAGEFTEIAFTDIAGACNGIEITECNPLIRNCIIEYNHIGIYCKDRGNGRIYNNTIVYNRASGIRNDLSNPSINSNIIAFNYNNGIINDGYSDMAIEYNCIYGNRDGNFFDCDPELGFKCKVNRNRDSVDIGYNIIKDPVFSGSISDSVETEQDVTIATDLSKVKNIDLAKTINSGKKSKPVAQKPAQVTGKYVLSKYSPCINAGNPSKVFFDPDGSINDLGVHGGPEFFREEN